MSRRLLGRVCHLACFATAICLIAIPLNAQTTAVAQVSGLVTDASGAIVPGAQVSMTETDKGLVRNTTSDTTGQYVLPNLPVGPYRLEVKANGFKDYIQNGIVLVVNNNIQINVGMQLGSVSETVEVNATTSLVETKETSVAAVIDQQRINDLPLNNRQATQLILTLGAAVYADSGDTGSKTFWSGTRIAVAGGREMVPPTSSTAAMRRMPCQTSICRSPFRMHSRNSALKPMPFPRVSALTPGRP